MNLPRAAIEGIIDVLNNLEIEFFFCGSLASSAHGLPRFTNHMEDGKKGGVSDMFSGAMDSQKIIEIINRRRDSFFDSRMLGTGADPLVETAAGVSRAISDEYDGLIKEVEDSK